MPNTYVNQDPVALQRSRTALVADDELSNRIVLKALLKKLGYEIVQAENGVMAVEQFQRYRPDIVFMDVMMPVMDGYDATLNIKEACGDHFVPVIFLTAMTDESALARCVEVGGDDFLTKPFSHTILKAKIQAMERISKLHRQISTIAGQLKHEEEIAEKVFSGAVAANNVALEQIHMLMRPAALFSGDVLLTANAPSGDLHVLLGDFTGHGLAAALGALPASEVFRSMTAKGFSCEQILGEINRKLFQLLPTGMFLAAQFVRISHQMDHASICNCGMPDIHILDAEGTHAKQYVSSGGLPLGITADVEFHDTFETINIDQGDRILLVSDGAIEARSPDGEYFGSERLKHAIARRDRTDTALERITRALDKFCRDAPQDDDISLVEIPCEQGLLIEWDMEKPASVSSPGIPQRGGAEPADTLEFSLTLRGARLRQADPVPSIINQIQELKGLASHRRMLFTILTELYANALDHGLLGLDSSTKRCAESFSHYYQERDRRLGRLYGGFIRISIWVQDHAKGGRIIIRVMDSGPGFDFKRAIGNQADETALCGRGIRLVNELCESLRYEAPGNKVEAIYVWDEE